MYLDNTSMVGDKEGQDKRKVSTVPLWEADVPQHSGRVQRPSLLPGTQWPVSDSSLYLPESSLAWVVAFSTSQGDDLHALNRGWNLVSTRYLDLRYCRGGESLPLTGVCPTNIGEQVMCVPYIPCAQGGVLRA